MEILDYDEKRNKVSKEIERVSREVDELQQKVLKLNFQLHYLQGYLSCLNETNLTVVKE